MNAFAVTYSSLSVNAVSMADTHEHLHTDYHSEELIGDLLPTRMSMMNRETLSMMSENECLDFIARNGILIPSEFMNDVEIGAFVKATIATIVANPNHEFAYNYYVTHEFANSIKTLVNSYLGILESDPVSGNQALSGYTLQDSTVIGLWDDSYRFYNCYAFSIGRTEQPPAYKTDWQYQPGDFSGESFSMSLTISQMADVVKKDLQTLGYSNITIHNSMPNYQTYDKLIAIRKGSRDYHFMKFDSGDWYHKPGGTAILQYNYTPSNNRIWTNEYSIYNVSYSEDTTYDSLIYYIGYDLPHTHSYTHTWLNYRQHTSSCTCGESHIRGHVVSSGWTGIGYATCLVCGGPAEVGFVEMSLPIKGNSVSSIFIEEHFSNGSYVLSNGVIVLSDEDLENFYNGTLIMPDCADCDYHIH